ncbi:hypothetical protein TCAL_03226 [Tigriopus californicus]|uniref:TFIIS N-terminal domain-containing protein n=1 Tax=Tigriopus californicus TaxID=6832 RepID=A0A553NT67_TIGCA|nr:protein IWS1 homolog [Tigriopus californicus]TRY68613.1 hypothetical protein TCAL_03226 [Tigriopus californicus]|eukprot:TCALIF_03226-PA protein Name:"Similar to IWS1 Protein IWS1 homolog (Homo sapiens)" AED:0.00 eAED:0.00 QI:161/1/0.66/1/1/1/3/0/416
MEQNSDITSNSSSILPNDQGSNPSDSDGDSEDFSRRPKPPSSDDEGLEAPKTKRIKVFLDDSSDDQESEIEDDPAKRDSESDAEDAQGAQVERNIVDSSSDEEILQEEVKERKEEMEPEPDPESTSKGALDFDLMMEQKRAANRRYRKRRDIEVINDNDDAIAKMIADMRQAAREDRDMNEQQIPATKKIGMLAKVLEHLAKVDLQLAFLEANLLSVMTDWLAPLPLDKALPHQSIRSAFLRYLFEIQIDDLSRLKESGIGKAVMYLYRHPRETRPNKDLAGKIINKWARPIFNVRTDFSTMTKEERELRDLEMSAKLELKKRNRTKNQVVHVEENETSGLKPGDPGWVGRARVPMVKNREYINRPDWQSHEDVSQTKKKEINLLEKHKRSFADRKKSTKAQHAVKISLEGKHMAL